MIVTITIAVELALCWYNKPGKIFKHANIKHMVKNLMNNIQCHIVVAQQQFVFAFMTASYIYEIILVAHFDDINSEL